MLEYCVAYFSDFAKNNNVNLKIDSAKILYDNEKLKIIIEFNSGLAILILDHLNENIEDFRKQFIFVLKERLK